MQSLTKIQWITIKINKGFLEQLNQRLSEKLSEASSPCNLPYLYFPRFKGGFIKAKFILQPLFLNASDCFLDWQKAQMDVCIIISKTGVCVQHKQLYVYITTYSCYQASKAWLSEVGIKVNTKLNLKYGLKGEVKRGRNIHIYRFHMKDTDRKAKCNPWLRKKPRSRSLAHTISCTLCSFLIQRWIYRLAIFE